MKEVSLNALKTFCAAWHCNNKDEVCQSWWQTSSRVHSPIEIKMECTVHMPQVKWGHAHAMHAILWIFEPPAVCELMHYANNSSWLMTIGCLSMHMLCALHPPHLQFKWAPSPTTLTVCWLAGNPSMYLPGVILSGWRKNIFQTASIINSHYFVLRWPKLISFF